MKNEIKKVRKYTILYYKRTEDRLSKRNKMIFFSFCMTCGVLSLDDFVNLGVDVTGCEKHIRDGGIF